MFFFVDILSMIDEESRRSGDLKNLGWAVHPGPAFELEPLFNFHKHDSRLWWKSINDDTGRKWIYMGDMSLTKQKYLKPFADFQKQLLEFVRKNIFDGQNYESDYWTIMKNEGKSKGQHPHTDYPLAHNTDNIKQKNKKAKNIYNQ